MKKIKYENIKCKKEVGKIMDEPDFLCGNTTFEVLQDGTVGPIKLVCTKCGARYGLWPKVYELVLPII